MIKKTVILAVVVVAFCVVLWVKFRTSEQRVVGQTDRATASARRVEEARSVSVLLFADPREANAECGCAEVIRLARNTGGVPGVFFREFDTRKGAAAAKRYGVRVSPTVIIADADDAETNRFEGESGDVIARLRAALNSLRGRPSDQKEADR